MNDTVTILTTATGKYITKAFRGPHYQAVQFNPGSEFLVNQIPVNNLESLAAVISELETEPTKAVTRGSLIKDPIGPVPRNKDTFASLPRQWCMIDIDSLAHGRYCPNDGAQRRPDPTIGRHQTSDHNQ